MTAIDLSPATARAMLGESCADPSVSRYSTAVWSHLVEPGDAVAGRLIDRYGAAEALERVLRGDACAEAVDAHEISEARKRWMPRTDTETVRCGLLTAQRRGVGLLVPGDAGWPSVLGDLGVHAPLCLWVRGDESALTRPRAVGIVGARAATSYGEHVAMELAADLAGSGIVVVSGAAYGIDAAAHRAALAADGSTVAVLAGGADRAYPAGNTGLIERIARTGAVVSESPPGAAPTKWRFLQRNRIIAALAHAVVVVEAGWRSGSLNTAGHAAAIGRRVGAVPGPITSAASAGCHRLLRDYPAECITSADDVRGLLGVGEAPQLDFGLTHGARTDDRTRVIDAMSTRSWRTADDVGRRSGMAVDVVEGILGLMLLGGEAERGEAGWRRARG